MNNPSLLHLGLPRERKNGKNSIRTHDSTTIPLSPRITGQYPLKIRDEKKRLGFLFFILVLLGLTAFEALLDIPRGMTPVGAYLGTLFKPANVHLYSVPAGAEVFVDGKLTGLTTPAHMRLDPGLHTFGLAKPGLLSVGITDVEGAASDSPCRVDLSGGVHEVDGVSWVVKSSTASWKKAVELTGILKKVVIFNSAPAGAKVYVGDAPDPAGETMLAVSLPVGETPVRIVKPGYEPFSRTVHVREQEDNSFSFTLSRAAPVPAVVPRPGKDDRNIPAAAMTRTIRLDMQHWFAYQDQGVKSETKAATGSLLEMAYEMGPGQWLGVQKNETADFSGIDGIQFDYKWEGASNTLEFKLVDRDGTNYGATYRIRGNPGTWTTIDIPKDRLRYWWGGDNTLDWRRVTVHFAVSRKNGAPGGSGKVSIRDFQVY